MNEVTLPTFTRHYKYTNKIDEGAFLIKYFVTTDIKPIDEHRPQQRSPIKQQEKQEFKSPIKPVEKSERKQRKEEEDRQERKLEMDRDQLQELRKYAKPNLKDIKVVENHSDERAQAKGKKKKYKKVQPQEAKEEEKPRRKREADDEEDYD